MATKKTNKSQAIRDYLASHKSAKPADVVTALKKKGVSVSAQFVSTIKSNSKNGKTTKNVKTTKKRSAKAAKPGRKKYGSTPAAKNGAVSLDRLLAAREFASTSGGVAQARAALDALESCQL